MQIGGKTHSLSSKEGKSEQSDYDDCHPVHLLFCVGLVNHICGVFQEVMRLHRPEESKSERSKATSVIDIP